MGGRKIDPRSVKRRVIWLGACLLVLTAAPGWAAVFEVDSSLDLPDANPGDGTCEALVGLGTCTLRAAIEEANATPNPAGARDRIEFDIDPFGVHTIQVSGTVYPEISESVVIDGWTQPGSVFNTDPEAFNGVVAIEIEGQLGTSEAGFAVIASDVDIKGVAVRGFGTGVFFGSGFEGELGRLEGCRIEDNTDTGVSITFDRIVIGGGDPRTANVISGNGDHAVFISNGIGATLVRGNVIGTEPSGFAPNGNGFSGGGVPAIADFGTGTTIVGNLIAAQNGPGIRADGSGGVIQANRIGTNRTGTSSAGFGNQGHGIVVNGDGWLIGGVASSQGNLIGGSLFSAIQLGSAQNRIEGNFIGATRQAKADIGNAEGGIFVSGSDNAIGGTFSDRANVIHHNGGQAIAVFDFAAQRIEIGYNSMLLNGDASLPGIDLTPFAGGVTPNDPGDPDEGANRLQNFPVIDAATRELGMTHIEGDFDSMPGDFVLQFYASRTCHPSGHGEGEQLLGRRSVTLPGDESFAFDFPVGAIGPAFTALATDSDGNTSEWSPIPRSPSAPISRTVSFTILRARRRSRPRIWRRSRPAWAKSSAATRR